VERLSRNRKTGSDVGKDELLELLRSIIKQVRDKRGLTRQELLGLYGEESLRIPLSVLQNENLGPLECIVKFLKEEKNLAFHEIASLLKRDARSIWTSYSQAAKKAKQKFSSRQLAGSISIDASIFADRKLSILEHVVIEMRDNLRMPVKEIAGELGRKPGTIWATYHNAGRKIRRGR